MPKQSEPKPPEAEKPAKPKSKGRGSPHFGAKITRLRNSSGKTMVGLSSDLLRTQGVLIHPPTIYRLEHGRQAPSLPEVIALADYFGVDIRWLIDTAVLPESEITRSDAGFDRAWRIVIELGPDEAIRRLIKADDRGGPFAVSGRTPPTAPVPSEAKNGKSSQG